MARYDVFPNPHAADRRHTPYVLDVQNDHINFIESRVVIPLRTQNYMPKAANALNPILDIEGRALVLDTASLAPVPVSMLRKPVTRANAFGGDIADALDALFGSY